MKPETMPTRQMVWMNYIPGGEWFQWLIVLSYGNSTKPFGIYPTQIKKKSFECQFKEEKHSKSRNKKLVDNTWSCQQGVINIYLCLNGIAWYNSHDVGQSFVI